MPRYDGGETVDTPACCLAAARLLPGWALGSHKAERYPNGTIKVTLHLAHRGGFAVPHSPFKHLAGFYTRRVHSYVKDSTATVWLTVRPD